ncbi:MAG TPA: tRNA (N6-isopentenyl adenosine(37)-C2)-methylthiotransferase MiaB [Chloroflexota bacterium]|nr:tRNA (N6-isopentenyl adenosine(37)-C2)-methylthiotransferase MiaB [Chloroflexota bacterium]
MMAESEAPKRYWIWTVGCQMNKVDSDRVADTMQARGYLPAQREEDADIVILNSCAVRESAERRVSGKLGNLVALKQEKPQLVLGLTGCSVSPDFEATRKRFRGADLYFQPTRIDQFLEQLDVIWPAPADEGVMACWEEQPAATEDKGPIAYVPISNGCDKFCTYCIVPYRRGRETSRPMLDIVDECGNLVKRGAREITLLGQRVNAYGKDFKDGTDLADLLRLVNDIPGLERLRFLTSYPKDMSDKLIASFAELDKVCEHLHLPVQSGNDAVLQRMRRGYTRDDYLRLVERIRAVAPDIVLSTDIIVGFCGETEEEFQETLSLVEEVRFTTVYSAAYSVRSGTLASRWEDDVPPDVKKDRLRRLGEVQERISLQQHQALRGSRVEILVESTESERHDTPQWQGRTRQNRRVFLPRGDESLLGQVVPVRIEKVSPWAMQGVLVA